LSYTHWIFAEGRGPQTESPETAGQGAPGQEVEGEQAAPAYEYTDPDFGENKISYPLLVLRTLAVLAALIIGIYLIFRMLLKNRNKTKSDSDIIKVLTSYPLAANKIIQIVEIAEKIMILGVTDSNINLIATVEDKEVVDRIKLLSSKEVKRGTSFKDQLLKIIGGKAFSGEGQISQFNDYKKRISRIKKL
jgi:flagellar protein FliO/FliZ